MTPFDNERIKEPAGLKPKVEETIDPDLNALFEGFDDLLNEGFIDDVIAKLRGVPEDQRDALARDFAAKRMQSANNNLKAVIRVLSVMGLIAEPEMIPVVMGVKKALAALNAHANARAA